MAIPPPPQSGLEILPTDPGPPTQATFEIGIPSTNTEDQSLSIVLFSPNLQIIASLDNTGSDATSTYSVSVSHGFTFSTTQSLSITEEVGVNIEIVTEKTSVTFALSFTEQWSTTETRQMSFSCPPGKKAFVYQGTLMAKIMALDAANAAYSWVSAPSKALTELIVTTSTPLGSAPSNSVSIQS
jgi:hypothetical protein